MLTSPISEGNVPNGIRIGKLIPPYPTFVSYQCVSFGLPTCADEAGGRDLLPVVVEPED